jgi:hypothetical protein
VPLLWKCRLAVAGLFFTATLALLLVAGARPVAVVAAAVYGSIPLWPRPSTVRGWVLPASKLGIVRPVAPAADALTALYSLVMVLECIVGVVVVLLGRRGWLEWLALGLLVGFAVVVLLAALVDLPLVPPEEL